MTDASRYPFLAEFPADLRVKLAELGAETPQHLREMIRLARGPMEQFLGPAWLTLVERWLASVTPERATEPDGWRPPPLGVPLGPPPRKILRPRSDTARRDELFEELQRLRRTKASPAKIRAIEEELDRLLATG